MLAPRPLTLAIAAALGSTVLASGVGCSGGGGGSTGAATSAATGGATTGPSTTTSTAGSTTGATTGFTGTDSTPPAFTLVTPARGGHVSGAATQAIEGTATDTQSGVATVEVNGQAATISGSSWSIPGNLTLGTNTFTIKVTDHQGNSTHSSWSAIYSPTFLPANQLVREGAAVRLSQNAISQLVPIAVQTITQGGFLNNALGNLSGLAGGILSIQSLNFGTPTVQATLVQGGVRAIIDVPNLDVDVTISGASMQMTASNLRIDATLLVSAANGVFTVSIPTAPSVAFTNFAIPGASPTVSSAMQAVFQPAIVTAMQSALPSGLQTALNGAAIAPRTFTVAGVTATVEAKPNNLTIDASNLRASGDANVTTAPVSGTAPSAPGSVSRAGATGAAPLFTTPHDVSLAVREELINRVLFAAWQSGKGKFTIDQAFVNQALTQLPFPIPFQVSLDISFLVPFFPALQALNPSGGSMPIAFELEAVLPPVVTVQGAPSLLSAALGELQAKILVDTGNGFQDLLVLALHAKLSASAQVQNGTAGNLALKVTIGQPVQVNAALLQNPFGLNPPDVDRFINTALPFVVQLAGGMIPPIQLPAIPGGLQPRNIDIFQDGQGGDFLTIEGDL